MSGGSGPTGLTEVSRGQAGISTGRPPRGQGVQSAAVFLLSDFISRKKSPVIPVCVGGDEMRMKFPCDENPKATRGAVAWGRRGVSHSVCRRPRNASDCHPCL